MDLWGIWGIEDRLVVSSVDSEDADFVHPGHFSYETEKNQRHEVDEENGGAVLGAMDTDQKEGNGENGEEFSRRGELLAVVELFPEGLVAELALVCIERSSNDPVEKDKREEMVCDVCAGPGQIWSHSWNDREENLEDDHNQNVRCPCTSRIHPGCVWIFKGCF